MAKTFSKVFTVIGTGLTFGAGYKTYDLLSDGEVFKAIPMSGIALMSSCITATAVLTVFERSNDSVNNEQIISE